MRVKTRPPSQAFTNFYHKNEEDQTKLTKVLDIAHELKPNGA